VTQARSGPRRLHVPDQWARGLASTGVELPMTSAVL